MHFQQLILLLSELLAENLLLIRENVHVFLGLHQLGVQVAVLGLGFDHFLLAAFRFFKQLLPLLLEQVNVILFAIQLRLQAADCS